MGILANRIARFKEDLAAKMVDTLKDRTRVRSGEARDGWEHQITEDGIEISNQVEHAKYLNNGTVHMDGDHMVETTAAEFPQIVSAAARDSK